MNFQALAAYVYNERARRAHIKGGGGSTVPAAAIEWVGDDAGFFWTLEGDESGYLLLEGDEA